MASGHQLNKLSTKTLNKQQQKKRNQNVKKSVKKAINLFSSLFGEYKINAFLKGNSFQIEGAYFNYIIKPSTMGVIEHTNNFNTGHIPYSLEIVDKEKQVVLGNLCVVFPDTPIIDQIIAAILHIQNDEKYFLSKAHVFKIQNREQCFKNEAFNYFFSLPRSHPIKHLNESRKETSTDMERQNKKSQLKPDVQKAIDEEFKKLLGNNASVINYIFNNSISFDELIEEQLQENQHNPKLEQFCTSLKEKQHE